LGADRLFVGYLEDLHIQGQVQQDGTALVPGPVKGPDGVGHRRLGRGDALRYHPDCGGEPALVDVEVGARLDGLGGEHHQRCSALRCLGQAGHGVGQPAPLVHGERGDRSAEPGVGVGHRGGPAFVPGGDEPGAAAH